MSSTKRSDWSILAGGQDARHCILPAQQLRRSFRKMHVDCIIQGERAEPWTKSSGPERNTSGTGTSRGTKQ